MAGFDQVFRIHDLPSDAVCALLNEPAVP
jgi:hypothetical protein